MRDFAKAFYASPAWQNTCDDYMKSVDALGQVIPAEGF